MAKMMDLPETIPVFPLSGALLLPRSRLPLHIFEPRYLAMVEDCMKTPERLIGMVQTYDGPDGVTTLQAVGCAGRLTAFSETEDGRYMITLSGVSRYRIAEPLEGFAPYLRCQVDWSGFQGDQGPAETLPDFDRAGLLALLERFFSKTGLSTDWDSLKEAEPELLIHSLAMLLPLEPEDKQALLEAPSLVTRHETLITLIEYALRGGTGEEVMQ